MVDTGPSSQWRKGLIASYSWAVNKLFEGDNYTVGYVKPLVRLFQSSIVISIFLATFKNFIVCCGASNGFGWAVTAEIEEKLN